jgi:hypothetical protein
MEQNKNLVLIMGKPNTGKSTSLRNMDQSSMVYLNADLKELPFRGRFAEEVEISDPLHIFEYIEQIEATPEITGAVLDTITFLMGMYERMYVATAKDTQKAWGDYGNYYKALIHAIKSGTKDYVIMAHEDTKYNEETLSYDVRVPIKGAVGKVGIEADFTTILGSKQMDIKRLEGISNALLNITEEEKEDGIKYVFTTRITKMHPGEKLRAPMGFWDRSELYIDNDVRQVFDRLKQYYGTGVAA